MSSMVEDPQPWAVQEWSILPLQVCSAGRHGSRTKAQECFWQTWKMHTQMVRGIRNHCVVSCRPRGRRESCLGNQELLVLRPKLMAGKMWIIFVLRHKCAHVFWGTGKNVGICKTLFGIEAVKTFLNMCLCYLASLRSTLWDKDSRAHCYLGLIPGK